MACECLQLRLYTCTQQRDQQFRVLRANYESGGRRRCENHERGALKLESPRGGFTSFGATPWHPKFFLFGAGCQSWSTTCVSLRQYITLGNKTLRNVTRQHITATALGNNTRATSLGNNTRRRQKAQQRHLATTPSNMCKTLRSDTLQYF